MSKNNKFVIICLILFYVHTANAILAEEIYTTQVEVGSKELSKEQRNFIIQQEFDKTLRKLTGKINGIAISDAEQYISKYEYQNLNHDENKIILKIYFDKNLIQKKLMDSKQLFLHEYRPVTIIWPKTNNPILLESIQELLQNITVVAKDYGLSIVYPVLDLQEVAILNQELTDHDFKNLIKAASKKYDADEVIVANCHHNNEDFLKINWKSLVNNWEFNNQLLENYENVNNLNLKTAAMLFLDKLMEHFINLYTGNSQVGKEIILLRIANVNDLENYVKVEKYLQSLAIVNNLYASAFKLGEVEFQIMAAGGKQAIKNVLATNRLLRENDHYNYDTVNSYDNNLLTYTLNL